MKLNKMKWLGAIIGLFTFLFFSCENEEVSKGETLKDKRHFEFINIEELKKNQLVFNDYRNSQKIIKQRSNRVSKKSVEQNIKIDETKILYVKDKNVKTYTFSTINVDKSNSYEIQNLVIYEKENLVKTLLVTYSLNELEYKKLKTGHFVDLRDRCKVEKINYKFSNRSETGPCYELVSVPVEWNQEGAVIQSVVGLFEVDCPEENNGGGGNESSDTGDNSSGGDGTSTGDSSNDTGSGTSTSNSTVDYSSEGSSYGGGFSSADDGESGGGGNSNFEYEGGIITAPIISTMEVLYNSLEEDQQEWLDNPANQSLIPQINDYLNSNSINNVVKPEAINFISELLNLAIVNNATFSFNHNLNSSNSLSFNTVEEFKDFLSTQSKNGSEFETIQQQNEKISSSKFWVGAPFNGVKVNVKQNMSPYTVSNVTTELFGLTLFADWKQSDFAVSISNNIVTVNVYGVSSIKVFFEGIGTIYHENKHFQIKIDKMTGEITSAVVID